MEHAYAISAEDRALVKRLTVVLVVVFLSTAAIEHLYKTYSRKFYDVTGSAQWIWAHHPMNADLPVAFFAARDVVLPQQRTFTHVEVLGDPEYTLFVNGKEIGGRLVGDAEAVDAKAVDRYDVSSLVRTGRNRIVVAVRSPQGMGGLIASVDIAPEIASWVKTDRSWRIYRRWVPELLLRDPANVPWESPVVLGEPPVGRWDYLTADSRPLAASPAKVIAPRASFPMVGYVTKIKVKSGIAVAGAEPGRATAFDFGFTRGRLRLTVDSDRAFSRAVDVRFANARDELDLPEGSLRPVVFAPGERSVTTSEPREFRYALVFARDVSAEVVQSAQ